MANKINNIEEFKESLKENPIIIDMNLVRAYKEIEDLKEQLQQHKSIVKVVDPDNLPMSLDEVLAFSEGTIMLGCLFLHPCGDGSVECQLHGEILHNITHYIEIKDIIKLMGDL